MKLRDLIAASAVMSGTTLTQGPQVQKFENELADYVSSSFSSVSNSATSSLICAYAALGVGPNSIVWTSPNTFVATANAAILLGANVDFVDVDYETGNMSLSILENKLLQAAQDNNLPDVVVPVHFSGTSVDMAQLNKLAKRFQFKIVEDASHALGGKYDGGAVGSAVYSDICVSSFHAIKMITTGEGGVAFTNDRELHGRMSRLRSHGITSDPDLMARVDDKEIWNYQQIDVGFNFRMTEFQAALGRSQLKRLKSFVRKRASVMRYYRENLNSAFEFLLVPEKVESSYHLGVIRVEEERVGVSQKYVYEWLHKHGIEANLHYIPVHTQPFYLGRGFSIGDYPNAERHFKTSISIPLHTNLSGRDLRRVTRVLNEVCKS